MSFDVEKFIDLTEASISAKNERISQLESDRARLIDALKEAKWLVDNAPVATIHKEWRERANTFVSTINKVLA